MGSVVARVEHLSWRKRSLCPFELEEGAAFDSVPWTGLQRRPQARSEPLWACFNPGVKRQEC